jgi:quercetin dioxygenase-like cupin family protein
MIDDTAGGRPSFLGSRPSSPFERWTVTLEPGDALPYVEADWHDAVVVVEAGEIELECMGGGRQRFVAGDVLCLSGLPLRTLRNPWPEPAVLVAVARRRRPMSSGSAGRHNQ